jgi:hypothetical protein
MRRDIRNCAYAAALVIGTLVGSQLPINSVRSSPDRMAETASDTPHQSRTPLFQALDPDALDGQREFIVPPTLGLDSKLPEGCESPVSFMTRSPLVHKAAHCLT